MSDKKPKYFKQEQHAYATEIPWRRPAFKIHKTLGHARAARVQRIARPNKDGLIEVHRYFYGKVRPEVCDVPTQVVDVYRHDPEQGWVHVPEESYNPQDWEFSHWDGNPGDVFKSSRAFFRRK